MKRPNRSIEVFDISLMAVVTKAMGAFLVLMLLLMPYYSSGPLGGTTLSDLNDQIDAVDKDIKSFSDQLAKTNKTPEELQQELAEMLARLKQARDLIDILKRETDELNAQIARLEDRTKDLEENVASLEEKTKKLDEQVAGLTQERDDLKEKVTSITDENATLKSEAKKTEEAFKPGQVTFSVIATSDKPCDFSVGIMKGNEGFYIDGKKLAFPLNSAPGTIGSSQTQLETTGASIASFKGTDAGEHYFVYAFFPDFHANITVDGWVGYLISKSKSDCDITVTFWRDDNALARALVISAPGHFKIPAGSLGVALQEIEITDKSFTSSAPTPETIAYFDKELAKAKKN